MAKIGRPDPMLAASVAGELVELPNRASDKNLVKHLDDLRAARSTWPGAWRVELREVERLISTSDSITLRRRLTRDARRTRRRLGLGGSPSLPYFPTELREEVALCVADREPITQLLEICAFDRLCGPAVYVAAPGLTAAKRRRQLRGMDRAAAAVLTAIHDFHESVAGLEPETFTPLNDMTNRFAAHPSFAREAVAAGAAALRPLQQIRALVERALRLPEMQSHRRADNASRWMALRVVALMSIAGFSDRTATDTLRLVHGFIRGSLKKHRLRGSVSVVVDPVPMAKVDLAAFWVVRRGFSKERIRVGLTREDVSSALAQRQPGKRSARNA